tara:strand:+ start:94 stop:486 length:393 start_codon:yes stop_codon:yes gene_type:complete
MDRFVKEICLDTSVLIEITKQNQTKANEILKYLEEKSISITAITLFEHLAGLKNEEDNKLDLKTYNFTKDDAVLASKMIVKLRKQGTEINFRDLFIASTCKSNDLELMTLDKHFKNFEQFGLRLVDFNIE